ncbi:Hypothetical_protein [Hexamita inflata]|uniref:Hypothetical_protein n=1 Tax=Hexamita inflata TaxID=28002 RepID=A0AA86R0Z4_9EUKA|nr:Hypothetical protein HINF_LOCUS51428 [Hexamita inflata]
MSHFCLKPTILDQLKKQLSDLEANLKPLRLQSLLTIDLLQQDQQEPIVQLELDKLKDFRETQALLDHNQQHKNFNNQQKQAFDNLVVVFKDIQQLQQKLKNISSFISDEIEAAQFDFKPQINTQIQRSSQQQITDLSVNQLKQEIIQLKEIIRLGNLDYKPKLVTSSPLQCEVEVIHIESFAPIVDSIQLSDPKIINLQKLLELEKRKNAILREENTNLKVKNGNNEKFIENKIREILKEK